MFKPILKLLFSCNFVGVVYSTNIQAHCFEVQLCCNGIFLIYNTVFSEFISTNLLSLEFSFYVVEIIGCVFIKNSTYNFQGL